MEPFTLILAAMLAQTTAEAPPPPPPPAAVRADADADGDGAVSRQEYIAGFDRMDTNRDGKLSREERRAAMPRMRGGRHGGPRGGDGHRGPPMRDDDRKGEDRTGDREVTRADFVAKAAARFDRIDANRDGKVDRAEMKAAHGTRRGRGGDHDGPPPPTATPSR